MIPEIQFIDLDNEVTTERRGIMNDEAIRLCLSVQVCYIEYLSRVNCCQIYHIAFSAYFCRIPDTYLNHI